MLLTRNAIKCTEGLSKGRNVDGVTGSDPGSSMSLDIPKVYFITLPKVDQALKKLINESEC